MKRMWLGARAAGGALARRIRHRGARARRQRYGVRWFVCTLLTCSFISSIVRSVVSMPNTAKATATSAYQKGSPQRRPDHPITFDDRGHSLIEQSINRRAFRTGIAVHIRTCVIFAHVNIVFLPINMLVNALLLGNRVVGPLDRWCSDDGRSGVWVM